MKLKKHQEGPLIIESKLLKKKTKKTFLIKCVDRRRPKKDGALSWENGKNCQALRENKMASGILLKDLSSGIPAKG